MQFLFLGTGSAFATEHYQSNALLEVNGKLLLIDAGGTLHLALKNIGLPLQALDAVYITHRHADHWGGAEFLAHGSYFNSAFKVDGVRRKLKLFAHPKVRDGLWNGLEGSAVLPDKVARLDDYFVIEKHFDSFEWEGVTFALVPTVHSLDNGVPMPCYGLTWNGSARRRIWFSADATLEPDHWLFNSADVIFHDCRTGSKVPVHAHYSELLGLPDAVRKKITLYHYDDGPRPNARADGFAGWAQQGVWLSL